MSRLLVMPFRAIIYMCVCVCVVMEMERKEKKQRAKSSNFLCVPETLIYHMTGDIIQDGCVNEMFIKSRQSAILNVICLRRSAIKTRNETNKINKKGTECHGLVYLPFFLSSIRSMLSSGT